MPANPRIDDYINKSQEFAKPILNHIRYLVHKNCPNIVESIKWSFPHFDYNGSILCSMASFKQHCTLNFWLGSVMKDEYGILNSTEKSAMGQFGQIKTIKDLPSDKILSAYIKQAMDLIEKGVKLPKKEKVTEKGISIPSYFLTKLKKNKTAFSTFENFSPSHKKEYLEWITEAKTEDTRNKRIATTLEWLQEGKQRNWKYVKK